MAFSCCVYDEGEAEKSEMDLMRKKGWGKKFMIKTQVSEPGMNRVNGKCPMTPVEVSFDSNYESFDIFTFSSTNVFEKGFITFK